MLMTCFFELSYSLLFFSVSSKVSDEDECVKFSGQVCSLNAKCENTIGSFKCICADGFKINADGKRCDGTYIHLRLLSSFILLVSVRLLFTIHRLLTRH